MTKDHATKTCSTARSTAGSCFPGNQKIRVLLASVKPVSPNRAPEWLHFRATDDFQGTGSIHSGKNNTIHCI
jgi:hypothetical protein